MLEKAEQSKKVDFWTDMNRVGLLAEAVHKQAQKKVSLKMRRI